MHSLNKESLQPSKSKSIIRKVLRFLLFVLAGIALLIAGLIVYVRIVATIHPPIPPDPKSVKWERKKIDSGFYTLRKNWFRKSETGLYELYVEGEPFDRGIVIGKISKELAQHQEVVFNKQIHLLVPSDFFLSTLKYFVAWYNRNLDDYVTEEYKLELLGLSETASHDFDDIAPPYQRLLNYHAAHDIGHALQNMSLVGCTSFATWGSKSADSSLIIGRNFDFYVGDEFAENKIVAFNNPTE